MVQLDAATHSVVPEHAGVTMLLKTAIQLRLILFLDFMCDQPFRSARIGLGGGLLFSENKASMKCRFLFAARDN